MKSLEDTIRDLAKKHKNRPSVLSEQYQRTNSNVNFVPQKKEDPRDYLIGNFKPSNTGFR
jgi:hypothetical protein